MNDKLQQLYDLYKSKGIINTVDFNTFSTADDSQRQKLYELGRKNGLFKTTDYGTFSSAFAPVKKKEVSQSTPSDGGISSAISKMVEKVPLESSAPKDENVYTGFPGKESKKYKLDKSTGVEVWKEYSSTNYNQKTGEQEDVFDKTITDPSRVNALNKQFNAKASTNEIEEVFVGYPGKEKNEYRVKGDLWQRKEKGQSNWTTVTNEGSIKALNYEFGKTISVPSPEEALKISKNESSLSKINNTIDKDLIGQDEEDAISKINKAIKGYNYLEAEQIGAGYDAIRVRNKVTGEYKDISLDNWSSDRDKEESEILKGFLSVNIGNSEYTEKYKQIQDLENKIKTAQPYKVPLIQKEINEAREELKDIDRKRKNDSRENKYKATAVFDKYAVDDINLNISKAIIKTEDLKKKAAEYSEYATTVNEAYRNGKITEEDYKNNYAVIIENNKKEIASEINAIKQDYNDVKKDSILVDDIAGYNYQVEAQRGNVLTGTASAFLKGFEGATRFAFEGISENAGGFKEGSFKGVMSEQLAPSTVSSVYTSSEGKSTFEQIVFGLAESGGAAMAGVLSGGPQGATFGLYASSYVQLKDQMNTPEFQDVPEYQKVLLSGVYGASVALLEKYGITKGFSKNPVGKRFLNSFLSKMVKELPSDATAEVIEAYVNKNVKTLIAKKAINLTGAGLIEYSTEAGQEATDIGLKALFNGLQGKKYFETPETWGEVFSQINEAGKLGFIGGAGMQSTTIALNTAKDALTKYQLNNIENTINNEDIKNIYVLNIKDRILSGEITKAQGQKELNKLKESEGLLNKIPVNITGDSRYEAFQLINERDELQKAIEGKEAALVTPITSRITEINNRLKTISENAVQVETTGEVSVQPEARVGEEVVQGESKTEPQGTTEEGKKEELNAVNDRILKIEQAASRGELLEDSEPRELKKLRDRKKELETLLKPIEITIDKPVIAKNATAEVDRVKALPIEAEDGATFNLDGAKYEGVGLVVPVDSMNTTIEELTPEMVADFVEERQKMIGDAGVVKAGIYKFPNSNQVSIDLSIVVPESSREQAIEFGRLADQESLFDLATYENVKTGGTGNNPMKFTPEQHREIAKALKEGRLPNVFAQADNRKKSDNLITESTISNIAQRQTTAIGQKIVTASKLVMKALPGVKIYIHQTKSEYEDAIGEKTGDNDKGAYTDGEIHINLEAGATLITLYHEAMHHALLVKGMKSGAILDLAKGLRSILSDKEIGKRLDNFISNYDENERAEEYLAELGAIMAESETELKTKGLLRFKALIGKIAKKLGIPAFSDAMKANDAVDFINALTRDIRTGEEIKTEGFQSKIIEPKVIKRQVKVSDDYKLSFVKQSDIIDIDSLIKEIADKGQRVWFWMADQLGRGFVYDEISREKHYLDAGPSFALDPENRNERIVWASGMKPKRLKKLIDDSDYIFLVSGAPDTAKLFNKAVYDLYIKKIGDYNLFKKEVLSNAPNKRIKEILEKYNSWEEIRESNDRKNLLSDFNKSFNKQRSKLNKILSSKNALVDVNLIRDDFYADNDFKQNDILMVLKPEKVGGKSKHSTYENDIIGDVIGVPDKVINAYDILSDEDKARYKNASDKDRNKQQSVTAPYGSGIRTLKPIIKRQKVDKVTSQVAGNKLFNTPLKEAESIAKSYMKSLGMVYTPVEKITKLDEGLSKRIARAYDEMKDDPNNKEVKAAYEAMVKETIDQYDAIVKEGYNVEINNTEPYANSEAMINDLRVNKKMNIFSTESGFGDEPITDKQRAENLLLKDSGKKDINGQTLLVNDIFRFVHDFFGHAKLGNSFGPIGEENAWRVHSEMYSPEARKAMTSETRGQNSWVNFSGVNDAAFKKRDKARELRKEGKIDEANKLVEEVYEDMKFADQKIGLLPEFAVEENAPSKIKRQKITQEERMDIEADGVFKKSLNRGVDWKTAIQNALDYIQKSKWYEGASDIDREQKIRDFKESKSQKLKKAPSVAKVLGKPKDNKITVNERTARNQQIRLEARAARDAKGDLNAKRKMLAAAISNMVKLGKIKASQAGILIKRISSLNLDNPVIVERFANYAEKVFDRADYQKRLDDAFALRKSIRKLLNTENQAEVVGMAKEFANIDPSLVEDIDVYIEMAEKVQNAVKPSRIKGFDVIMKEAVNIAMVSEFSKAELERQENIKKQELLAIHNYLEDISKDMSLKEIQDIIKLLKESPEAVDDKESKVMEFLKNRFDFMAGIVDTMINTGVDPMTGEDVQFDEKQKSLMKRVLKIDLNQMSTREAIKIVESINNFLTNQITSGLESAVSSYEGATNAQNLVDNGTKAKDVSMFFSKGVGRAYTNQLFSLPLLMERMFNGTKSALNIMTKMGLNTVINGVNLANKLHDNIITSYSKEAFYGKKGFMDQKNVFERGMLAFLKRNLIGSETMVKAEFERRVRIIEQSIESLKNSGDKKLVELGEAYQEVYDKLGVDKKDLDVINSRAESMNKEAVDWWIKEWSKHYKDLSDVSLSVYNAMLGSDTNYTPDKFKKIVQTSGVIEDADSIGGIDYTDKNKTGVLIESSRPNNAPSGRYISLDFDSNNSNALKGALVDINTASGIRQVDGFMSSKAFNSLVPNAKDRAYLVERINNYIRRAKGKRIVNKDVWNDIDSFTNFIGGLGVTQSLAGLSQTISQTGPVITNTLINAGSFIPVTSQSNAWLDKLGMAISNRGMESSSTIESADARIEANDANYAKKTIKAIENVNKFYLKQLLVKPDIWAARSSFITYYLQDLKNRGISTNFEWETHEPDMEAANYAQMMVDRQQNISDPLLAGEFMATEDGFKRLMRKVMLPFASFILNQKARMYNDFSTLTSRTSTAQDKKNAARSLSGLVAEMAAYHAIGATVRYMYDEIAKQIMGDEDDEEEKKRKKVNITKYPIRSFINDIISPLPITDGIVTDGANFLLSFYEPLSNEDIRKKVKEKNNALKIKGEYDMTKEEEQEFIDNLKEKNKFQLFTDDQNARKYGILGIAFDNYSNLYETSKMAYSGEFEDDYQGRITVKKLAGDDKDYVEAALIPLYLSSLGLLPKDLSTVSNRVINRVKKRAFTENQADKIAIVEGELKRKLRPFEIEIVNAKNKPETAIDELNFIKRNGGLTEAQSVEYVKLMDAIGSPTTGDIIKIKRGQKASQILE